MISGSVEGGDNGELNKTADHKGIQAPHSHIFHFTKLHSLTLSNSVLQLTTTF